MNKTKIVYYLFPFHLDLFERSLYQLKKASYYSNTKKYLAIDIVLDLSDFNFNWDKCKIPKEFFIDKFEYLEKYCDFCKEVNFEINNEMKGSGEQQRRIYNNNKGEYNIILLDPDIYFPIEIFHIFDQVVPQIEKEYSTYVLTPQVGKFWDSSWDVLSNDTYLKSDIKFDEIDVFELSLRSDTDNISLIKNYNHKFGGGWFTYYSAKLTELMKVPESIGYFHHFDLYQQEKFKILNKFNYDIPQFIIKNCLIQEDRKYSQEYNYLTKYIPLEPSTNSSELSKEIYNNVIKELNILYQNEGKINS
jgi:phage FluMu protein Com